MAVGAFSAKSERRTRTLRNAGTATLVGGGFNTPHCYRMSRVSTPKSTRKKEKSIRDKPKQRAKPRDQRETTTDHHSSLFLLFFEKRKFWPQSHSRKKTLLGLCVTFSSILDDGFGSFYLRPTTCLLPVSKQENSLLASERIYILCIRCHHLPSIYQ